MRQLLKRYADADISRREFVTALSALGFSAAAVDSLAAATAPAAAASPADPAREFTGTGAQVLVEQLIAADVRYMFCTTATGMSSFFDAVSERPQLKLVQSIAESQATSMAHGYELATGKPAALFVPGVAIPSAMNNLYNAWKDRSALLVLSDGPANDFGGRNGFQAMDDWLAPLVTFTKWRWEVSTPKQIGEMTRRALKLAQTPPGGPVHLRLPLNVLAEDGIREYIQPAARFTIPVELAPKPEQIERAARLLIDAKYPMLAVGAEVTRAGANADVLAFAEMLGVEVAQSFSVYGDFPFRHPQWAGFTGPGAPRNLGKVDVFFNLGGQMPDPTLLGAPVPRGARVIDARVNHEAIANTHPVDVAIAGGTRETIKAMHAAIEDLVPKKKLARMRDERLAASRGFTEQIMNGRRASAEPRWNDSPMSWERTSHELDLALEPDAVIVSELDYFTPYYWMDFSPGKKTLIGLTTGYALGWGIGAAIGAKIARPDKQIACLLGDGALLFGQVEAMWTAARYDIPILIFVLNNRSYDGERTRIYRQSPLARNRDTRDKWKDMSCYLGDPVVDFTSLARAFSIQGEMVESPAALPDALKRATNAMRDGRPYLIDAVIQQLGPGANVNWYPDLSVAASRTRQV